jgi:predicted alpha/beta superfamily hydrolase
MKLRNVVVAATLLVSGSLTAGGMSHAAEETPAPRDYILNKAQHFEVKAQSNGRIYHIFVSAPQGEAPAQGFPVIYTSDGNAMFPQFAATANLLRMNSRAVIVGIGYPGDSQFDTNRRYFDLTPKTPAEVVQASGRGGDDRETGGNDLFLDFIDKELKPLIEKQYKIDRQKQTLFGHSLGGLFVLHTLFSRPEAFQSYVAAAPSIWWNNGSVLEEKKAFLLRYGKRTLPVRLLVTSNTDPARRRPTPGEAPANAPVNPRQAAVESAGDIVAELNKIEGFKAEYRVFENESHISMVPGSINSGLRFILGDTPRTPAGQPVATAPQP